MTKIMDINHKRVCDISDDRKTVEIRRKDCVTIIRTKPDGTLSVTHERIEHIK